MTTISKVTLNLDAARVLVSHARERTRRPTVGGGYTEDGITVDLCNAIGLLIDTLELMDRGAS